MKVLHTISSSGMYGAEGVILNLSQRINSSGHTSLLGIFKHGDRLESPLFEAARAAGIESYLIPCKGPIDFSSVRTLRSLLRRTNADVLHAHGYKADIYSRLAVRHREIPLISTCHNWLDTDAATRLYGYLDRLALRHFTRVVAVSAAVRGRLIDSGVLNERVSIIRNGVEVDAFSSQERIARGLGPLTIGFAGRLSIEKGADLFLRIGAAIHERFPTVRFLIVGEGPERGRLDLLIEQLGLREFVSMPGRCDDMPTFYASLNILVSSSRTEGLPMGLLEAMASRVPIVATDVGDVSSLVRDGETGFLVPSGELDRMENGIIKLLQDESLRDRFGAAGHELVAREFSAEAMTKQYLDLYKEALRETESHPRS
jgi:glycosyltransferase involved in cell wall biosynthesis